LNNKREDGMPLTPRSGDEEEVFQPEKIPTKIPLLKTQSSSVGSVIAYHTEAAFAVRKIIIEKAKDKIKELAKAETTVLLSHSHQRAKIMADRLEDNLIKNQNFGRGCMYQDAN
jgi:hypothetical protein